MDCPFTLVGIGKVPPYIVSLRNPVQWRSGGKVPFYIGVKTHFKEFLSFFYCQVICLDEGRVLIPGNALAVAKQKYFKGLYKLVWRYHLFQQRDSPIKHRDSPI